MMVGRSLRNGWILCLFANTANGINELRGVRKRIRVDPTLFDLRNCYNGVARAGKGPEWNELAVGQRQEAARQPPACPQADVAVTAGSGGKTPAPSVPRAPARALRGGDCARMRRNGTLWRLQRDGAFERGSLLSEASKGG